MRWVALLLALDCMSPGIAAAAAPDGALRVAQADVKPLAQILDTIKQRFPGHALDAQLVKQGDPVYRVKWLGEDGKVREVTSDARTGQIVDVR